jgi:hypothetical protein
MFQPNLLLPVPAPLPARCSTSPLEVNTKQDRINIDKATQTKIVLNIAFGNFIKTPYIEIPHSIRVLKYIIF